MSLKSIPYGRQSIDADDIKAVIKVLKSDWLTQGPGVQAFEEALCRYTGAHFAVCVANGTVALHLAYLAAGLKAKDEAITTPLTFVATANAVLYAGARPVFADVDSQTGNIDPEMIKKKITAKTKIIVPVHFGGYPCDLSKIDAMARRKKIMVIEDACHALGASYQADGRWLKIGSCQHSDMTVFSFHPVKSITCAEGGAIMTNNPLLYKKLMSLRSHGITKEASLFVNGKAHGPWYYEMQELGFNARITDMQCALGISQLKKLDDFVTRRRQITEMYRQAWSDSEYFDIPPQEDKVKSAWHLFAIRLKGPLADKRREFFSLLRNLGLGVQVHYIPVHLQPYYQKLKYKRGLCPRAEDFYEHEISLPLYPSMGSKDVRQVIDIVNKAIKEIKD